MIIATTIDEVRNIAKQWKRRGLTTGLVPTMGFLHEGHQSLIQRSVDENDRTIVSIFVNPIQFGQQADLATYPRDLERDSSICRDVRVDLVFAPSAEVMYPDPFFSYIDMTTLTNHLCSRDRPGHFRGVCTVVCKLFHITTPDRAYFGQKDAQQLAIIGKMVEELNFDLELVPCPTIREKDGLAQSSRNVRLTKEERRAAPVLYKSLVAAVDAITEGERTSEKLRRLMLEILKREPPVSIDYVEIVDWHTLQPIDTLKKPALLAVAIHLSDVRLVDNYLWE